MTTLRIRDSVVLTAILLTGLSLAPRARAQTALTHRIESSGGVSQPGLGWATGSVTPPSFSLLADEGDRGAQPGISPQGNDLTSGILATQSVFQYRIPIQVPPGVKGVQPNLALVYDPNSGNGLLGVGWQLSGLPVITRVNGGNGINFNGQDTFAHSGMGVLKDQGNSIYRSKKETFTKFERFGTCGDGPCYWVATDRSGTKSYYGATSGGRTDAKRVRSASDSSVVTWALAEVVDLFGNSYDVKYVTYTLSGSTLVGAGTTYNMVRIYPDVITYTHGNSITAQYSVQFNFESRTDTELGFFQGSGPGQQTFGRLKTVTVKSVGDQLIREYRLSYAYGSATRRSHLTNFQEVGSDGSTALPAQTFYWRDGGVATVQRTLAADDAALAGDFNGDGKTDIATIKSTSKSVTLNVSLSNGSTFASPQSWFTLEDKDTSYSLATVGDFNGDGKTDLAVRWVNCWESGIQGISHCQGHIGIAYSTGSGFDSPKANVVFSSGIHTDEFEINVRTGDFDGDGRTDLQCFDGPLPHPDEVAGDFNGDGRTDFAYRESGGIGIDLATASGFQHVSWPVTVPGNGPLYAGDFNGDNKTDLLVFGTYPNGNQATLLISTGSSFVTLGPFTFPVFGSVAVGDFNGDGKSDIATWNPGNNATLYYHLSTGTGFIETTVTGNFYFQSLVGDFSGQGRKDLVTSINSTFYANVSDAALDAGKAPDLINRIDNGLLKVMTITYESSPRVPNAIGGSGPGVSNTRPINLVTEVAVDDGNYGLYRTRYDYSNLRMSLGAILERRNLGFASITLTDEQTGQWTIISFRQDAPFERLGLQIDNYAGGNADHTLMKRLVHYYESCPSVANACAATIPGANTELVLERQAYTIKYELGALAFELWTNYTHDRYGNAAVVSDDATDLPNVTVTKNYDFDEGIWFLEKLREDKTTSGSATLNWTKYDWANNSIVTKSAWLNTTNSWLDTTMTYDGNGNLLSVTLPSTGDGIVRKTIYVYGDEFHTSPTVTTNALNQSTKIHHRYDGLIDAVTDLNGHTTSTTHDAFGRKYDELRPDDSMTRHYYLSYGQVNQGNATLTHLLGSSQGLYRREYFDGTGFVHRVALSGDCPAKSDPTGVGYRYIDYGKDLAGRPSEVSQPKCWNESPATTKTTYDAASRINTVTTPDGKVSTYAYDTNFYSVTDPNGKVTKTYFDARGRITKVVDAINQTTTYSYDPFGRLLSVTLPDGTTTSHTYDSLNRRVAFTDPQISSQTVTITYDALNRVVRYEPAGGTPTNFKYDGDSTFCSIGRLSNVTDAGGDTWFIYTSTGLLSRVTRKTKDGLTLAQSYEYDYANRLTRITYPGYSAAGYTYTSGGNLSTVSLDGTVLAAWSGYNARGKPASVSYANGVTTTYGYDVMDHLTSLNTTNGTTTLQDLTYDWYNFPNTSGINLGKISDNRDNRIALSDGSNTDETQTYTYDDLYRLTAATGSWGSNTPGVYNTKTYAYDSIGNLTAFGGIVDRTLTPNGQQVVSGTGLANVTYDVFGNMTHKELDGNSWSYEWTAENFLKTVWKNGVRTADMTYDAWGQRARKVYTPPEGGTTVTTDYFGKTFERRTYSDGITPPRETIYIYANGQLVAQVTRPPAVAAALKAANRWRGEVAAASLYNSHSFVGAAKKAYHYLNAAAVHPETLRRIALFLFALFATFVLAALLASRISGAVPRSSFSPTLRLASLSVLMLFTLSACGGGGPSGEALFRAKDYLLSGDTTKGPAIGTYFFHRNHVNSSSLVTDSVGAEVTRIVYLPFGEISKPNSSGGDIVTSKFTGQEHDEETGLYYYNARHYDPAIGRFVSADSIIPNLLDAQAFNRYAYVGNNPITHDDPSGHDAMPGMGGNYHESDREVSGDAGFGHYMRNQYQASYTKPADVDCYANLRSRLVDYWQIQLPLRLLNWPLARHSFWEVSDVLGQKHVVSAGPIDTSAGRTIGVTVSEDVENGDDNIHAGLAWSSGASPNSCPGVRDLLAAARSFPSGGYPYSAAGPNSNSTARELGIVGGFRPEGPIGAYGWDRAIHDWCDAGRRY